MLATIAFALTTNTPAAITVARLHTYQGLRAVNVSTAKSGPMLIACLENGQARVMNAGGGGAVVSLVGHVQPCYGGALSPDGKLAATGDEQAKIYLWDAKTGKKIKEFSRDKGHKRGIQSIVFSADSKQILTVGKDDAIALWNVSGPHPVAKIVGEPANFYGANFGAGGSVWTGTQVEGLRLLAPKTLKTVAKMSLPGGQGANAFALNPAKTLGATGGRDAVVTLWDLKARKRTLTLKGHTDYVTAVDFSPNGKVMATSSADGTVIVWDVKSGKSITKIPNRSYVGSPVAFTGDGKFLVLTNASDEVEVFTVSPPQK